MKHIFLFTSIRILSVVTVITSQTASSQELRPLSTDRPDTTESAYTVDAGHFQFEIEIANTTRNGAERDYTLGEINAKYGLDSQTDLQVVMPLYTQQRGGSEGYGDTEIRLKRNIWGNDEGSTAFALMPYIKLPSANADLGNDKLEGGLIAPYSFEGPNDWAYAVMGQIDFVADDAGSGTDCAGLVSATAGHSLTEKTGFFLELVAAQLVVPDSQLEGYFNSGITWNAQANLQFDTGIRVGLTDAATDFSPFLGVSMKY